MAATLCSFLLLSIKFLAANGDDLMVMELEEGGIITKGIDKLQFSHLGKIGTMGYMTMYHAIESGRLFTLRTENLNKNHLKHEWELFKYLGATIGLENQAQTEAEIAEAALPRVYAYGILTIYENGVKVLSEKAILMQPTDNRPFNEILELESFMKDSQCHYSIGLQLLKTIAYLHSKKVRHGNINPLNFAVLLSDEKFKIGLIGLFSAAICEDDGNLLYAATYDVSEYSYRSLHLDNAMNQNIVVGPGGPRLTDDHESAAYTLLRLFGFPLGWKTDVDKVFEFAEELSEAKQKDSSTSEKLKKKVSKMCKIISMKKTDMPKHIHQNLRKGNPMCDVLLEMIQSARAPDVLGHAEGYIYNVNGLSIKAAEELFIKMWETDVSAIAIKKIEEFKITRLSELLKFIYSVSKNLF